MEYLDVISMMHSVCLFSIVFDARYESQKKEHGRGVKCIKAKFP